MKIAYDPGRRCDNCGAKSPPFWPRKRSQAGDLLCDTCISKEAIGAYYESDEVAKVAHDSPGTDILRHCPFCGAGQITGRSDGTVECGFCDAAFTVQTQPNLPSTPQTVNDELYLHPDMSEPGVPGDSINPEDPEETVFPLEDEFQSDGIGEGDNPFDDIEKMTYKVGSVTMSESEYIRHLALKHSDDWNRTLSAVRSSRRIAKPQPAEKIKVSSGTSGTYVHLDNISTAPNGLMKSLYHWDGVSDITVNDTHYINYTLPGDVVRQKVDEAGLWNAEQGRVFWHPYDDPSGSFYKG